MFNPPAALAAFFMSTIPAPAQQTVLMQCGDRAETVRKLEDRYRERPIAIGLTSGGVLLEILTSVDGATWTAPETQPAKRSEASTPKFVSVVETQIQFGMTDQIFALASRRILREREIGSRTSTDD